MNDMSVTAQMDVLRRARTLEQQAWDELLSLSSSREILLGSRGRTGRLDRQGRLEAAVKKAAGDGLDTRNVQVLLSEVRQIRWSIMMIWDFLARSIAGKLLRHFEADLRFDDLHQLGRIGLYEAMKRFDPDRDISIATYAKWWIRASITRHGPADSLATGAREQFRTLRKIEGIGIKRDEDIAARMGLTTKRIRVLRQMFQPVQSLDEPCDDSRESRTFGESLSADSTQMELADFSAILEHVQKLPERQRTIIILRFGLDGRGERTLVEIGEDMKLSRERIRQIERDGLRSVRDMVGLPPTDTSSVVTEKREQDPQARIRLRRRIVDIVNRYPQGITRNGVIRIAGEGQKDVNFELDLAAAHGEIRTNGLPRGRTMLYPASDEVGLAAK